MLIYLIIASVCYLGAWSKAPKKAYQLSFFAMWFFMAFRGLDLSSKVDGFYYHDFFENDVTTLAQFDFNILSYTRTVQAKTGFGWGFGLLSAVCKTICSRFEFFQVVFTALLFVLLAMVMRELHLSDQEKCLFLFFYMTQQMLWYFCNLLRQAPANLIVWYVMLHEFKDHKWIKRILLIGVAMLLHTSAALALVMIVAWEWIQKKGTLKFAQAALLPGALLMLFSDKIVGICISFMSTYIDSRYSMYVGMAEKSNVINFGLRMVILFLLCFFYRRVQCEKRDKLLAASTLCYLVGAFNGSLFVRALEYVAIGNYGGLALVHRAFSGTRQSKFVANLLLYLAFMVIFIRFFFTNAEFLIDYHFFF